MFELAVNLVHLTNGPQWKFFEARMHWGFDDFIIKGCSPKIALIIIITRNCLQLCTVFTIRQTIRAIPTISARITKKRYTFLRNFFKKYVRNNQPKLAKDRVGINNFGKRLAEFGIFPAILFFQVLEGETFPYIFTLSPKHVQKELTGYLYWAECSWRRRKLSLPWLQDFFI